MEKEPMNRRRFLMGSGALFTSTIMSPEVQAEESENIISREDIEAREVSIEQARRYPIHEDVFDEADRFFLVSRISNDGRIRVVFNIINEVGLSGRIFVFGEDGAGFIVNKAEGVLDDNCELVFEAYKETGSRVTSEDGEGCDIEAFYFPGVPLLS